MEKADPRRKLFCKLFDVSNFFDPTNRTPSSGPFCRRKTLKIHKDWVFELDMEGRREQKRIHDRRRTHAKKAAKRKLRKEQGGEDSIQDREEGSSRAKKKVKT